jgi:hypothetical protein
MEKTTVTARARFEEIIDLAQLAAENGFEGFDFEGMVAFAQKEIGKLDKKAAKAKETAAAKKAEGDVLTQVVLDCLTDEVEAIAIITERVAAQEGCEDVTVGKVQYRLGALAREGKAVKGEVVIPASETSKKRTVSGYSRA